MKIKKDTFIEEYTKLAIAHGEIYNDVNAEDVSKKCNILSKKSSKYVDFLANDPIFAKEILDTLIFYDNFHIMKSVANLLWEFNYRMDDCHRLFEKIVNNKDKKYGLTVIAMGILYLDIKRGTAKRSRKFPKLD